MINWDKIQFDELGYVILQENPQILCTVEELEKRVQNRTEQDGFWKELLDDWQQKGILN